MSLGCKEMWDIDCVLAHLNKVYSQHRFILWGRSMGAVAALLYLAMKALRAEEKKKEKDSMNDCDWVVGGIYDSPFYSLEKLTL